MGLLWDAEVDIRPPYTVVGEFYMSVRGFTFISAGRYSLMSDSTGNYRASYRQLTSRQPPPCKSLCRIPDIQCMELGVVHTRLAEVIATWPEKRELILIIKDIVNPVDFQVN